MKNLLKTAKKTNLRVVTDSTSKHSIFARSNKTWRTAFITIFAIVGTILLIRSFAATPTTAHLWVDLNGGTCIRQTTPATYSDSTACGSFDAAWDKAFAGDTIVVKTGTYPRQVVDGHKTAEAKIIGENGTTVAGTIADCKPEFGSAAVFCANANFMTLENVTLDALSGINPSNGSQINASNVTYRNVNIHGSYVNISIVGPNFTWQKGSHGQDGIDGLPRTCAMSTGEPVWVYSTNVVLDGIRFNPKKIQSGGTNTYCGPDVTPHLETIRTESGATNLTVKNSWFVAGSDAGSGHIFTSTGAQGLKLFNNLFEPVNGSYAIQASNTCDWTVAYNTFMQGLSLACDGGTWVGNLGVQSPGCGGTHIKNVWQGSGSCGSDTFVGSTSLGIGTAGHISTTSPAKNAGEADTASDFCTRTIAAGGLGSVDREGGVRPTDGACDAGAHEFGSTPGTPPETADRYVSPSGNDANACTQAAPCRTLNRAYLVAVAGDAVEVAAGTYGSGTIDFRSGMTGSPVTFSPAAGATVNFTDLNIDAGNITLQGPNFNIRSMNIGNSGSATTRRSDITLDNVNVDAQDTLNTDAIWLGNTANFTLKNSKVGNTMAGPGSSDTAKSVMTCAGNSTCYNSNMVFENNLFYDADAPSGSLAHLECIWAGGVQGFTLRKNIFRDCTFFDVFITVVVANNQPQPKDHIFEDNLFGQTVHPDGHDFGYTINLHGDVQPNNFVFQRNTIEGAIATANGGSAIQAGGWKIIGNIIAGGVWLSEPEPQGCRAGIVFDYNVMPNSCGTNTTSVSSATIRSGWVAPKASYAGADDFHLNSSSPALNKGRPADAGSLDFDGVARANPPDAGAFEFTDGGTSPPPAPPPPPGPPPPPPSSTPMAAYNFEEGAGTTANDATSNNNDATLSGAIWSTGGKNGKGLATNGTSYAQAPDSASLDLGASGTIETWVKLNGLGVWHGLVSKGNANADEVHNYAVEIDQANRVRCILGNGTTSTVLISAATLSANTYYHVACSWGAGTMSLYVNGTANATATSITPTANTSPLYLGQFGGNTDFLNGVLDDVRVYNKALTASEIAGDMNTPVPSESASSCNFTGTKAGEIDGVSPVTAHDLSLFLSHYNQTNNSYPAGDFDSDCNITGHDLSMLLSNFGK